MDFIIAFGIVIGAADCIFGNRLKLGEKFEEGFLCMGSTALSMVGIMCVAPLLGTWIGKLTIPLFRLFHIDPAMTGCLLANNMGGYALATVLADDPAVGNFSGLIVSSALGATVVYTVPLGLRLIDGKHQDAFARGIMLGLCGVPFGSFAGGLLMGLPLGTLLINMVPIVLFSGLLCFGLLFWKERMTRGFMYFAKGVNVVTIAGLALASVQYVLGTEWVKGMDSLESSLMVVADMCVVQLGSIPVAYLLIDLLKKPLVRLGAHIGINEVSVASFPVACVNTVSSFLMTKDMDERGIILNAAWYTNTIAVFTAHYAFTKAMAPELIGAVMAAKLIGGAAAVLAAYAATRGMSGPRKK